MEKITLEKYLKNSIEYVSIDGTKKILLQMKYYICKIIKKDGTFGTGFFCNIPSPEKKELLPVIITNNHVLNKDDIKNQNSIEITINNDNQRKIIRLDKFRKKFTDETLDITILEIKPKIDKINKFLDISEDIINKEQDLLNLAYIKKSIYILHYPKGKNAQVSYGLSNCIIGDNINHTCNTENGSSGAPILSIDNFSLIGIHNSSSNLKFNKGIFIKSVLNKLFGINEKNASKNKIKNDKNDKKSNLRIYENIVNNNSQSNNNHKINTNNFNENFNNMKNIYNINNNIFNNNNNNYFNNFNNNLNSMNCFSNNNLNNYINNNVYNNLYNNNNLNNYLNNNLNNNNLNNQFNNNNYINLNTNNYNYLNKGNNNNNIYSYNNMFNNSSNYNNNSDKKMNCNHSIDKYFNNSKINNYNNNNYNDYNNNIIRPNMNDNINNNNKSYIISNKINNKSFCGNQRNYIDIQLNNSFNNQLLNKSFKVKQQNFVNSRNNSFIGNHNNYNNFNTNKLFNNSFVGNNNNYTPNILNTDNNINYDNNNEVNDFIELLDMSY